MRRYERLRKSAKSIAKSKGHDMWYFIQERAYCLKCNAYIETDSLNNQVDETTV